MNPIKPAPLPVEISYIRRDLDTISKSIEEIKHDIKSQYVPRYELNTLTEDFHAFRRSSVTQDQFWPVKVIVYGFVGLILTSVLFAVLAIVIVSRNAT